jgi:hypothetical protein
MIRKILKLQNIGLLQDATQNGAVDLARVTAIYADNGMQLRHDFKRG